MENYNLNILIGEAKAKKLVKSFSRNGYFDLPKVKEIVRENPEIITGLIGQKAKDILTSAYSLSTETNLTALRISCLSDDKEGLSNPEFVVNFLREEIGISSSEKFFAIFLNGRNQVLGYQNLFSGTVNQAQVYPREILKKALDYNAAALVISHNHPSGNAKPSEDDLVLTKKLEKLLEEINIRLHDHIIVTQKEAFSIKANRYIVE
jgi:DNA repair protein RadC